MTRWRARDHPRVCGEHKLTGESEYRAAGSSPRVRGTQIATREHNLFVGIIPACAGNTADERYEMWQYRDHPRVCGEHPGRIRADTEHTGSSPRVRGTL